MALTKPRIIELLLVTTLPTMVVAQRGLPPLGLMVATLVGGALAAGGANAINMFVDRDIDRLMHRTRNRPAGHRGRHPQAALIFALGLEVAAFVELWLAVNLLSAVLAVSATAFYVFVYTLWLKRRSSQNIVIGAAGAVPVLVGWAAVTGSLAWTPVVLFAIIFIWTPPHFWALAVRYRDDYRAADVPMLPVVASMRRTTGQILAYTVVLVAVTLLFAPVAAHGAPLHRDGGRAGSGVHRHGGAAVGPGAPGPGLRRRRHAAVHVLDHLPHPALRRHGRRRPRPVPLMPGAGAGTPPGDVQSPVAALDPDPPASGDGRRRDTGCR